jgi:hypothetical protein
VRLYTQDYPGFPARCSGQICVGGFLHRKPHGLRGSTKRHRARVRPGLVSAVPSGLFRFNLIVDLFSSSAFQNQPMRKKLIWTSLILSVPFDKLRAGSTGLLSPVKGYHVPLKTDLAVLLEMKYDNFGIGSEPQRGSPRTGSA